MELTTEQRTRLHKEFEVLGRERVISMMFSFTCLMGCALEHAFGKSHDLHVYHLPGTGFESSLTAGRQLIRQKIGAWRSGRWTAVVSLIECLYEDWNIYDGCWPDDPREALRKEAITWLAEHGNAVEHVVARKSVCSSNE